MQFNTGEIVKYPSELTAYTYKRFRRIIEFKFES